jgi:hypothetical protein
MNSTSRFATIMTALAIGAGGVAYLGYRGLTSGVPARPTVQLVSQTESAEDALARLQQRGAYLMSIMVCQDCHTPKGPDMQPIPGMTMAGHPQDMPGAEWEPSMMEKNILVTMGPTLTSFAGPFGTSYAANLTPDKETGIGTMSADDLIRSWRTGKHWKEPRGIMPPMPAQFYASATDDDIRALHAFLMTLEPVKNRVPAAKPAPGGVPH